MAWSEEKKKEYQRKYYRDHRAERIAYAHDYYVHCNAYLKKYHRDRYNQIQSDRRKAMKEYFQRNVKKYSESQGCIKKVRLARGWTAKQLGEMIGRTPASIYHYESGYVKAPWDELIRFMPELKEARENV